MALSESRAVITAEAAKTLVLLSFMGKEEEEKPSPSSGFPSGDKKPSRKLSLF